MDEFKIYTVYATKIPGFKHTSFTTIESALDYFEKSIPTKFSSAQQRQNAKKDKFYSWLDGYKKPTLRIIETNLV